MKKISKIISGIVLAGMAFVTTDYSEAREKASSSESKNSEDKLLSAQVKEAESILKDNDEKSLKSARELIRTRKDKVSKQAYELLGKFLKLNELNEEMSEKYGLDPVAVGSNYEPASEKDDVRIFGVVLENRKLNMALIASKLEYQKWLSEKQEEAMSVVGALIEKAEEAITEAKEDAEEEAEEQAEEEEEAKEAEEEEKAAEKAAEAKAKKKAAEEAAEEKAKAKEEKKEAEKKKKAEKKEKEKAKAKEKKQKEEEKARKKKEKKKAKAKKKEEEAEALAKEEAEKKEAKQKAKKEKKEKKKKKTVTEDSSGEAAAKEGSTDQPTKVETAEIESKS